MSATRTPPNPPGLSQRPDPVARGRTRLPAVTAAAPLRLGPVSARVPLRAVAVAVLAAGALFLLYCLDLGLGDVQVSLQRTIRTLFSETDPAAELIITQLRLPQATVAVLVGLALGLAGALTQTFARNPLASPDILGVTDGASAAAVGVIVIAGSSGYGGGLVTGSLQTVGLPLAAFAGGLLTAALLYLLSWCGGIDGARLVLVGIGIGAALTAVVEWLLVRARITDAASAQVWLNGSLSSRGWDQAWPVAIALVVLAPLSFWLVSSLNALTLGDDTARSLGVRLQTTQLLVLVAAVGLAAACVSAVGPLEFVALVVPQVALRLTGGARPPLVTSMLLGGVLVVGSDLVTRVVLPFSVPAGVVTAAIGAPYLICLLVRTRRKATT